MKIKRNEEFVEGAEVYARVVFRNPLKLVILGKKVSNSIIAWYDTYKLWDCEMLTDLGEPIQRNTIAIEPEDFEEEYKQINNIT